MAWRNPRSAGKAALALAVALASPLVVGATGTSANLEQRLLIAQNEARAEVGVAPLAWDPALANDAAGWSAELARAGVMEHSNDDDTDEPQGENLWMGTHGYFGPEAMVGAWVDEKKHFRPGTFPEVSATGDWEDVGHYTQIAWRDSKAVGCAVAHGAEDDFLVCRYSAAGNVDGERVY